MGPSLIPIVDKEALDEKVSSGLSRKNHQDPPCSVGLTSCACASLALAEGHAITNQAGKKLLPESTQKNTMIYPSSDVLKHGVIQRDLDEQTLELYNTYWQKLKFSL